MHDDWMPMRENLLPSERCDRCGAQAYTQWSNRLLFCAHHNAVHEVALDTSGERMIADMRHKLIEHERLTGAL